MRIGMEILVANALIELIENKSCRRVNIKQLMKYGTKIVRLLVSTNEEVVLFYSRDDTNSFIHNYSDFYKLERDVDGEEYIVLRDDKNVDDLRDYFRANMTLEMLYAFINQESVEVLLKA